MHTQTRYKVIVKVKMLVSSGAQACVALLGCIWPWWLRMAHERQVGSLFSNESFLFSLTMRPHDDDQHKENMPAWYEDSTTEAHARASPPFISGVLAPASFLIPPTSRPTPPNVRPLSRLPSGAGTPLSCFTHFLLLDHTRLLSSFSLPSTRPHIPQPILSSTCLPPKDVSTSEHQA